MPRFLSIFGAWYVAAAFISSPLASLASFVAYVYLGGSPPNVDLAIGAGLVVWVLIALATWLLYTYGKSEAKDVNPAQYQVIKERRWIDADLIDASPVVSGQPLAEAARKDAVSLRTELDALLKTSARGKWLSAEGYLDAFRDIDRMEEAMFLLVPIAQVLVMAGDDQCRLAGMPESNCQTTRLTAAIDRLTKAGSGDDYSARADLQAVRRWINLHREDQWRALVGERNRAMVAAAVAGILTYLGLFSVLVAHINTRALQVALALIITGTLVSVLHQATIVQTTAPDLEDFGQSVARLLSAAFVSGVIALLGVIVFQGVGISINGVQLIRSFTSWKETFDWTMNPGAFLLAAIFGLTPSLLFDLLQNQADVIRKQLGPSPTAASRS